jgi:hypothetical protein
MRRHQVDDLALAFVAELGAEDDNIHRCLLYPTA